MRKMMRLWAGALALTALMTTPAMADDATLYELGNGADVTFSCAGEFNRAVVHNIPSGYFLSNRSEVADIQVTAEGTQYTYGMDDLVLTFTPLGEFTPAFTASFPSNCWEVPGAAPLPALDERPTREDSDPEPYAEVTELQEKVLRFMALRAI